MNYEIWLKMFLYMITEDDESVYCIDNFITYERKVDGILLFTYFLPFAFDVCFHIMLSINKLIILKSMTNVISIS